MTTRLRRRATGLGLALLLGGLAACSSAPLPSDELAQGGELPSGTVVDPDTGQVVDAETGEVVDPVTGEAAGAGAVGSVSGPAAPGSGPATGSTGSGSGTTAAPGAPVPGGPSKPGAPVPARSTLFTAAEETIGITDKQITLCAHAALTYGAAFNTSTDDLNVFWTAINEAGGVYGRKVVVTYENDDYKPEKAVEAATACKGRDIFFLLGGIGFDQIPAVRDWAERNRMLYVHHTATVEGTANQRFSFAPLPTVERTGEAFGQLYLSKYKGKKIGIIKRDGVNWEPGVRAFKALVGSAGKIVAETKVPQNKGNYTEDVLAMKNGGAEVVWIWENALGATQIVKQIKAQNYKPNMMLFPFNLTSQTLEDDAMTPVLDGVAMFTAYSRGDYSGSFASYADDVKLFEQQYRKHRPNVDLGGVGGDLLFLNWTAQKALYHQLMDCGKDCNRNRFVDVLEGYDKRPTSSVCPIDFTGGNHRQGSDKLIFMETYRSPSGKVNWRNTRACVGRG